ncbi:glycine cleavage system T protein [Xylaria sp. CBS 124048]|nr:glycine cleavage system T protein [Xylaria sp. CBS 124048]
MNFPIRLASAAGKGIRTLGNSRSQSPNLVRALSFSTIASTNTTATRSIPAKSRTRSTCPSWQNSRRLPVQSRRTYAASPSSDKSLNRTALYDLHRAHGAKMVPFGGFEMPVVYAGQGVKASHHFTREKASLFDVGHMVQHRFEGPGAADFLQRITPGSIKALPTHQSTLSALLWPETGGIVDDTIITRLGPERFYVVTNAACRAKDLGYLNEQLTAWDGADVRHVVLDGWGLIALQGPLSESLLAQVLEDPAAVNLPKLYFGQSIFAKVKGGAEQVLISRGGYTGEDGFEISIAPSDTVSVTETLLKTAGPEALQLAGLGARDSLRLEAGMCLYGHDLDDTTTPVEGRLAWIIGQDRRNPASDVEKFHGADVILKQLMPKKSGGGVSRRRVGLVIEGAPAREGTKILDVSPCGRELVEVGAITSGCPSPTLGKNIAMGYVADGVHQTGSEFRVIIRGRTQKAVITTMPFVPTKYWKAPVAA